MKSWETQQHRTKQEGHNKHEHHPNCCPDSVRLTEAKEAPGRGSEKTHLRPDATRIRLICRFPAADSEIPAA